MASRAPIESYIAVAPVANLGADIYTNERPIAMQAGRGLVFGGLLMSQAISAASATVSGEHLVYAQYTTFLRPASAKNIIYRVERVSDSRNYATRIVRAFERVAGGAVGEDAVCMAAISFQSNRPAAGQALNYARPIPDLDGLHPDDTSPSSGREVVESSRSGRLQPFKPDDEPFDWRVGSMAMGDEPSECVTTSFVRAAPIPLADSSPAVNFAALTYMSDELLLGIALLANPDIVGEKYKNVVNAATLNHHIRFHDPTANVEDWMVCERSTHWGADGRAMINQMVWSHRTGHLVCSCTQEATIRLRVPKM